MTAGRYHLHIVDGGDRSSTVTASMIFAHLALRCGQLRNYLLVSASSTDVKKNRDAANPNRLASSLGGSSAGGTRPTYVGTSDAGTDDQLLLAGEALLRGEGLSHNGISDESSWGEVLSSVKDRIIPYESFSRSFAESEVSLAMSKGPYFDFIATADVASFDYLLDYYLGPCLRSAKKGQLGVGRYGGVPEKRDRRIGLIHILCGEPVRAGYLLQRFMELLLEIDTKSAAGESGKAGEEAWINRVDHVVLQMYQLLSVDVLFTVV
ncbi:hypothetical protein, conserved [Trypanosoma brucei gambiense DAL972]|uniref:Uncharacterized protein n=1 Tax=Trypanosoma brucei gambiense (strain MHOM/CI/86/DAL972) TaxID=679716 RepID=C9ZVP4_TRYB9|nr:hypothetical protein, conserved [Trypanosoma brucei gambiense DAL972]CBH13482.1 hypothetical protein, conserved [Trypanosoma brucei gambiense DAL972]|eukprot:XP_011775759.1 hypothetical protein, conserved [Trypanosoma brucei gambiense DAL972]